MTLAILNTLFLIAFLLSAAVQYNDPDRLFWIPIYLFAAGMCVAQLRNSQPKWLPPVLLTVCLVWMGLLLPAIVGKVSPAEIFESISMKTKAVEEAREIGGLALVAIWAAVLTLKNRR